MDFSHSVWDTDCVRASAKAQHEDSVGSSETGMGLELGMVLSFSQKASTRLLT